MGKGRVHVIYDEPELLQQIRQAMEREFFQVQGFLQGEAGLAAILAEPPEAAVLGNTRGMDGLELCRRLRADARTSGLPLLLVTSGGTNDRVVALEAGADDSLARPFGIRELVARLKAILRRSSFRPPAEEILQAGDLVIDIGRHLVTFRGRALTLTMAEFSILRFMAMRPGRVLRRAEIIQGALGKNTDGLSRTIDVHMAAIRRKLGRHAAFITTVRGIGYKIADTLQPVAARAH
ncbi:MAG: response regulator transcription factor [Planctomycetaceae bacterium]|nr:response regulator transcription factor [Planctomycetaceae bacterium]